MGVKSCISIDIGPGGRGGEEESSYTISEDELSCISIDIGPGFLVLEEKKNIREI